MPSPSSDLQDDMSGITKSSWQREQQHAIVTSSFIYGNNLDIDRGLETPESCHYCQNWTCESVLEKATTGLSYIFTTSHVTSHKLSEVNQSSEGIFVGSDGSEWLH